MKAYLEPYKRSWEKLKPVERRITVFFGMVFFLLLNWWLVFPHFHDFSQNRTRLQADQATNAIYLSEVNRKAEYNRKRGELQADGSEVLPEDQAIDFVHFYNSRAVSNHVTVTSQGQLLTRTNEFFLEQQMGISVQGDETNLVKFLYSLAAGNSMMRVRSMNLHPDPSHMQLSAGLTLVASYQKKLPERGKATTTPATGAKPTTVAAAKPPPPAPVTTAAPVTKIPPVKTPLPTAVSNRLASALARRVSTNRPPNLNDKKP